MKKIILLNVLIVLLISCASSSSTTNKQKDSKGNLNLAREKFGMEIASLTKESKEKSGLSHGIIVTNVYSFYPANKAGVVKGDIILSLDNNNILTLKEFNELLKSYKFRYGQVTLGVSRNNQLQKIKVHLD